MSLPAAIEKLPPPLAESAGASWGELATREPDLAARLLADTKLATSLGRVWGASEFVSGLCARRPHLLAELLESGELLAADPAGNWPRVRFALEQDEDVFMTALRGHRQRALLRIAWRDLAGWASLEETLRDLSALADACIEAALAYSAHQLAQRHGWPGPDEQGSPCELIVVAMGKLGASELNFSSDIDLIFLYPLAGESDGERPLTHEAWFTRQARQVIRLLDTRTEDGFVFRVDMRLRPFGASGPLVMSLPAFEVYLQQHGRDWERYAWVKARALSGTQAQRTAMAEVLRPFVYRRYLDYGVFESLRAMKTKVARLSRQKARQHDIKLGPGGIREIEFMVQCFQLIRGGNDPALRTRGLLAALARLAERSQLEPATAEALARHYRFLRVLENRIQAMQDRQVHELPADETSRCRLVLAMAVDDWQALSDEVASRTAHVHSVFKELVLGPVEPEDNDASELVGAWEQSLSEEACLALLARAGFESPKEVLGLLRALRSGNLYRRMDAAGRQRLNRLMPLMLQAAANTSPATDVLRNVVAIIETVGRRSAYFALLNENRDVRNRLVSLCAGSRLLAEEISEHPVLLDELIDPRVFETPPSSTEMHHELERRFAGIADTDLEAQMEVLRTFQRAWVFRIALADLYGVLPLMKVSDRLTELAEIMLQKVLDLAQAQLAAKHGRPRKQNSGEGAGFAIVGYGKLGGLELGYGSDLDLVFVYDGATQGHTDGQHVIDDGVFFTRLAQRIVHMLSTQTRSGRLYEVDTRLRPSGQSGLLVIEIGAFEDYQRDKAWTWEHQALLRARTVAGDRGLAQEFEALRRRVLCQPRRQPALRAEIVKMRERMRAELDTSESGRFDLKQGRGGITDIEFLVQYFVLLHADAYPELVHWSDNIRQLESLANARVISAATAESLAEIYRTYRQRLHRLALDRAGKSVPETELSNERAAVGRLWQQEFG